MPKSMDSSDHVSYSLPRITHPRSLTLTVSRVLALTTALLLLSCRSTASDDIFEPFSTSNLNPFSQLYGPPMTRSAALTGVGQFDWHLQFEAANNFTEGTTGIEAVIIDGETYRTNLSLRYGLSDKWELGVDVPYVSHRGGSLDSFIENWHDFWGLPNGGREKVKDDVLQYVYQANGLINPNITGSINGPGDIRLGIGYLLSDRSDSSRTWALRGGVKLPTGDADDFTGSDSTDAFLGLHLSDPDLFDQPALYFHGNVGIVRLGDGEILEAQLEEWMLYGSTSLAWSLSENISLKAQFDFHSAVFDSDLKELGDFAGQLVVGGSVRLGEKSRLDISVSEDIITDTSPDVVLQLGLHFSP